jgi:uncharacterized repeat protein (TIGR01451 family)
VVSGQAIRCTIETLPSGGRLEISLRVKIRSGGESIVNQASVVSSTSDPDGRDNAASWRVSLEDEKPRRPSVALAKGKGKASLAVTKTALVKRPVKSGEVFGYRIAVRNTGKVAAVAVVVCDVPSRRLVFVSAPGATFSNGRACWRIGSLAPGAKRTAHVRTRLDSNTKRGTVRNDAVASGKNTGKAAVKDTVKVQVRGVKAGRPGGVTG